MDQREEKLPAWARQLIDSLRLRVESATEPLVREIARLRPRAELLEARNSALTELLDCAAKGGHKTAKEIMDILMAYELILKKRED